MSAYGTPCSGELQFWAVMRAQMMEQTKQLKRIADALEARNAASFVRVKPIVKGSSINIGDMVIWTDPETGEATDGWKVKSVPAPLSQEDAEAVVGAAVDAMGVYTIANQSGSEAEVHLCELMPATCGKEV